MCLSLLLFKRTRREWAEGGFEILEETREHYLAFASLYVYISREFGLRDEIIYPQYPRFSVERCNGGIQCEKMSDPYLRGVMLRYVLTWYCVHHLRRVTRTAARPHARTHARTILEERYIRTRNQDQGEFFFLHNDTKDVWKIRRGNVFLKQTESRRDDKHSLTNTPS